MAGLLWPVPSYSGTFIVQSASSKNEVTLLYYNESANELESLISVTPGKTYPSTISVVSLGITATGANVSNVLAWSGDVKPEDISGYNPGPGENPAPGENPDPGVNPDSGGNTPPDYTKFWVDGTEEWTLTEVFENTAEYKENVTTYIAMNGGKLIVDQALPENITISSKVSGYGGKVVLTENNELYRSDLSAEGGKEIELSGAGDYYLESGVSLGEAIVLGTAWKGTVYTGAIADGAELDINALGNQNSTVQLGATGDVSVKSLTADTVGNVNTPGALMLTSGSSVVNKLNVNGMLTLGTASNAADLTAARLSSQGITLGNIGSSITAGELAGDTLNITIADSELLKLPVGSTTVLTLGKAFEGATTLNGKAEVMGSNGKMFYTLTWESPVTRAATGYELNLYATLNPDYIPEKLGETVAYYSTNGRAGRIILNKAYTEQNPQANAADGALAGIIDTVDAGAMTDDTLAAVAGASTAVLGQALSGDVERQLRAIRNRSVAGNDAGTIALVDEKSGMVTTSAPARFFAWVNAEGNRAEQNDDGTAAGYTLNSWGATLGAGMQVTPQLTLGLALTAMYGDLKSDGPDSLDGDMDTTYLSAFARYTSGSWSHALIGTVGSMDADYTRRALSYSNGGETNGTAYGLMYELSREFALSNSSSISPVFNIAYRHTEVDGYSEHGTDAALNVGEQNLDTVTVGLGARYTAEVGQQTINRPCAFEARALAKYDLGDRQSDTSVSFVGQAARARIESAELGAFGVELGAGIAVPVGSGSMFADGAVELRCDYTNLNATVGYRLTF